MDDQAFYDVPAILDYVCQATGEDRVNWVGHSLGGMLMFAFLEYSPHADRVATFVGMGSAAVLSDAPDIEKLRCNRGLRMLLRAVSTGRMARPMVLARPPGLERVDSFYYTAANVDRATISRFYGYTLEDPGPGALKQLDPFLKYGHLLSADGKKDYYNGLGAIRTPTLFVAAEGDVLTNKRSVEQTYERLGSPDKTLQGCGKKDGHYADYGHCDLVWSRHAPIEVFPPIVGWLDSRQPAARSVPGRRPVFASSQEPVDANLRPGLEAVPGGR
jgi:pimeloyl-ACP methyl ester carboxylesterase